MKALAALLALVTIAGCGSEPTVDADGSATSLVAGPTTTATGDTMTDGARTAQDGDTVAVHYRGTLDDGSEFDSSHGRDPLSFTIGSGEVIAGFDEAVRGLAVGESRTVRIEPDEAYGERTDEAVIEVPKASAPDDLSVGDQVTLNNNLPATVVEIGDGTITVDANHPLAGEALTFDIELVSIG